MGEEESGETVAYADASEFDGKESPGSFVGFRKIFCPEEKTTFPPKVHSHHFHISQFPGQRWQVKLDRGGDLR